MIKISYKLSEITHSNTRNYMAVFELLVTWHRDVSYNYSNIFSRPTRATLPTTITLKVQVAVAEAESVTITVTGATAGLFCAVGTGNRPPDGMLYVKVYDPVPPVAVAGA